MFELLRGDFNSEVLPERHLARNRCRCACDSGNECYPETVPTDQKSSDPHSERALLWGFERERSLSELVQRSCFLEKVLLCALVWLSPPFCTGRWGCIRVSPCGGSRRR